MVGSENSFLPTDLMKYAEELLNESRLQELSSQRANYSWLKSRNLHLERLSTAKDLEKLKPMIFKMSPENCANIAVKLDNLTGELSSTSDILITFKKLLEDEYSIQLLERNVRRGKEMRNLRNRVNKVHPDLSPERRRPVVSFIL